MTYEFKITNFGINGWYIICLDGYIYKDCYLHSNFDMKKYIYPISKGYYSTYEKAESFLKKWAKKNCKEIIETNFFSDRTVYIFLQEDFIKEEEFKI